MQISSTFNVAVNHMIDTKERLVENTQAIAKGSVNLESPQESTMQSSLNYEVDAVAEKMIQNQQLMYEFESSGVMVKTADEMLGTTVDIKA